MTVEQDTLQALVETGAARRGGLADGTTTRREMAASTFAPRTGEVVALADGSGTVFAKG